MKKTKKIILITLIGLGSLLSLNFTDSYFEISKNLDIFASLYRELNVYYVDETKPGELMKTGIDAMLKSLDPYTNYIPESQIEDYRFMTTGQYGGIGALISKRGEYIVISEIYEDFPAHKAGLMPGDRLIEIDGNSVVSKSTSEISSFLKGQPKVEVKLLIERGEGESKKTMEKNFERQEIKIKDVPYYGMLDQHTGYITLNSFTQTASKEFTEAFKALQENPDFKQLVFDLRGNGGGLLREAVSIVNVFVDRGTKVVDTRGRIKDWNKIYKALNSPLDKDIPVTVLINESSASASEIVAGALQDLDRAVIVGNNSFGKGLVQQPRSLSYNAKLKVTVAKYYIPSGRCIQKIDYSNRNEDGNAQSVPDSLITSFKSLKNERTLFDGNGIKPDITVDPRSIGRITETLIIKSHIFDYATKYRATHNSIAAAEDFVVTDEEYNDFVAFLEGKDYDYETETEKILKKLKTVAEDESYFDQAKGEYETLKSKMEADKKDDLIKFKAEIKELMGYEIVSRYYYDKGRIQASLKKDPVVLKAIEMFNKEGVYDNILTGKFEPTDIKN